MKYVFKYFGIYKGLFSYSLNKELQYRVNFIILVLGYILYLSANMALFGILYNWTDSIGGWNYYEILIFVGTYHIIHGLWDFGTALNIERISQYISQGNLDFILLKPINSLFYIVFRNMNFAPLINVLLGFGIVGVGVIHSDEVISLATVLLYLLMIMNGVIMVTTIQLIFQLLSFWIIRTSFVNNLFYQAIKFTEKPDVIYTGMLRRVLTFIIPMIWVVSYPSRVLMMKLNMNSIVWDFIIMFIVLLIGGIGWNLSVKYYSSASS